MASLTFSAKEPAAVTADALVLAVASSPGRPRLLGGDVFPPPIRRALTSALDVVGTSGGSDSVARIPAVPGIAARSVAFTGVGRVRGDVPAETLRRAAGAAARELAGSRRVAFALPTPDGGSSAAVAEGALLGAYRFDRYRTADGTAKDPVGAVVVVGPAMGPGSRRSAVRRATVLAEAVHRTRDLVNTAPVDLYPASFADAAVAAVASVPVSATVLDERKLARGGYGGILGVGLGSARPPRLVRLDYAPDGAAVHVALIGKGITFDSGGLSIKPAQGMDAMKSDMSGAAAVLHTVVAAAELKLPIRITGWLALAENMPSSTAQRPSDVLTIRGGRTVEVLNTDAEGRLVLADAMVAAGELSPDLMIDIATLTGAQLVALGARTSAVMANDEELRGRVHALADEVGEPFWPMPLPPELRPSLDSRVADIANIGERFGGMLVAGLFLQEFVPDRSAGTAGADGARPQPDPVPWAHLDIAGPAWNTGGPHGYTPTGGTGVGVRTLLRLCEDVAERGVPGTAGNGSPTDI